jgi:hypothetical protein
MTNAINASTPLDGNVNLYNEECEDKEADVKQYLRIVVSSMYASLGTRPDISYAVTTLSRFNSKPREMHMTAAKRVLGYLKRTSKLKRNNAHPTASYSDQRSKSAVHVYEFLFDSPAMENVKYLLQKDAFLCPQEHREEVSLVQEK